MVLSRCNAIDIENTKVENIFCCSSPRCSIHNVNIDRILKIVFNTVHTIVCSFVYKQFVPTVIHTYIHTDIHNRFYGGVVLCILVSLNNRVN